MTTVTNEALMEAHGASPQHTREERVAIGNAMLIVVGASGALSPNEMGCFVSIVTAYGAPPDAIDAWQRFDYANARLSDHLKVDPRLARHLLYDAIRICRADGVYAARGRAKVAEAARLLGVQPGLVASLEAIVETEEALRNARAVLQKCTGPKGAAPGAVASLRELAAQEASLRRTRIATMDEDHGRPPPPA
jgi:tellurite resistance protein